MKLHLMRAIALTLILAVGPAVAEEPTYPPQLPGGKLVATAQSDKFLQAPSTIAEEVAVAKTPPTVDFLYYPVQTYPAKTWSVWGDGLAANGKYYSSIGDHNAPDGNAFVFEYDPESKKLRTLVNLQEVLKLPEGHYQPGKIHSRLDLGSDGWIYFSTHRGSTRITTDEYHYKGDWILRVHPETAKVEIVTHAPVPKHCIPTSVLDPERLIFYGGTASGDYKDKTVMFFAYDVKNRKVLHTAKDGPYRALIFAKSTGRVYYCNDDEGQLMRYDPESGKPPQPIKGQLGLRAATQETDDGFVYTVSKKGGALWRFNTQTEAIDKIGNIMVGKQSYTTTLDIDPTGRYLYYTPGAHGGSEADGTPIVQYDLKTHRKKVIAFLHPFLKEKYGYVPIGTFGSAVSEDGSKVYVTWNGARTPPKKNGRYPFESCAQTTIHIPASERP